MISKDGQETEYTLQPPLEDSYRRGWLRYLRPGRWMYFKGNALYVLDDQGAIVSRHLGQPDDH